MSPSWEVRTLAEACEIKPAKSEVKQQLSDSDMVSFMPMEDLGIDQKFVSANQARKLSDVVGSYTYFAEGDVLLAKITPCFENGKLGIATRLENGVGFGSSEYIVFRTAPILDPQWLYYYLSRDSFRADGEARMGGAVGHKRVAKEFIESYPIPLPPLAEQHRIVAILDEAFAGIATAKANAEKSLQCSQAVLDGYLEDVFTSRGVDWTDRRLSTLCEEITVGYVGPMKNEYVPQGVPFLRSQNIRPFGISLENLVFVPETFHCSIAKSHLRPGDVAIVRTGYPGTAAVIPDDLPDANCSDLVIARPGKEVNPHFLTAFFNSAFGKRMVMGKLVGAAQKHFNVGAAKDVLLHLPPMSEQDRIVARIAELRGETRRLQSLYTRKLAALDELRQSLLQRAFSGQLT